MNAALKNITADFDDVKTLIDGLRAIKKEENKLKRRLKTKSDYYSFLETMTGQNIHKEELVKAIKQFFKSLKLDVHQMPENDGIEDMRLFYNNRLIIIEITGTSKPVNDQGKIHQISKHINIRKAFFPNHIVTGLFISNHHNTIPFAKRSTNPYGKEIGTIAAHNEYTITTTLNLLESYISIKKGNLTVEEFIDKLTQTGIFK